MEFLFIGIFGGVIGFCLGIGFNYVSEACEHEWELGKYYEDITPQNGLTGKIKSDKYTEIHRCINCKELKTCVERF